MRQDGLPDAFLVNEMCRGRPGPQADEVNRRSGEEVLREYWEKAEGPLSVGSGKGEFLQRLITKGG